MKRRRGADPVMQLRLPLSSGAAPAAALVQQEPEPEPERGLATDAEVAAFTAWLYWPENPPANS